MEYTILYEKNIHTLADKVREHISNGWKPQGGVAFDEDDWPTQAMTKDDKNKERL